MHNAHKMQACNIPVGTRRAKDHCDIDGRTQTDWVTYVHQETHTGRTGCLVSPPVLVVGKPGGPPRPLRIELELQLLDGLLGLRAQLPVLRRK